MLIGCSSVQTKYIKVYPDASWLVENKLGITKDMLNTYGQVRNKALPQAIETVDLCNADKKLIRDWMLEKTGDAND